MMNMVNFIYQEVGGVRYVDIIDLYMFFNYRWNGKWGYEEILIKLYDDFIKHPYSHLLEYEYFIKKEFKKRNL